MGPTGRKLAHWPGVRDFLKGAMATKAVLSLALALLPRLPGSEEILRAMSSYHNPVSSLASKLNTSDVLSQNQMSCLCSLCMWMCVHMYTQNT